MSVTKHQIFKIKILDNKTFEFDKVVEAEISTFLMEPNNVYVNHSICVLSEDVEQYGNSMTINKIVVVSLIYKDLKDTELNLKNTSKKVQAVVTKEIEKGSKRNEPKLETELEKNISHLLKKVQKNEEISKK